MSSAAAPRPRSENSGRQVHLGLVAVFLVLCFAQFYLAGRGVFGQSDYDAHKAVGRITQVVSLLILIASAAFPATRNRIDVGMAAGLLVLVVIQGIIGNFDHPAIAAYHPLNALLIIGLAFHMVTRDARALGSR